MMQRFLLLVSALLLAIACGWANVPLLTPATARASADKAIGDLYELGDAQSNRYFHENKWDHAIVVLDWMIELEPHNIDPYASAGLLLWSSGENDAALRYYQRAIAVNPNNSSAYFELGIFYYRIKKYPDAVIQLGKAIDCGLPSPQRHLYGHALEKAGRTADALAFWQRILTEDPTDTIAQAQIKRLQATPPASQSPAAAPASDKSKDTE